MNQQLTQNLFTKPQHWNLTLKYVSLPLIYKTSTYWLSGGDLIAIGAEYHSQCVVSLYNRDRDRDKASTSHDDCHTNTARRTAFAELVSYVQAATLDLDTQVRQCAVHLQNLHLLAKWRRLNRYWGRIPQSMPSVAVQQG